MFDLGTGLRNYGTQLMEKGGAEGFQGAMLLSHLHWDHVQGLPFFVPLHIPGNVVDIYGPRQQDGPLAEVFEGMMRPAVLPDPARPARGLGAASTTPATTTSPCTTPRCGRGGSATSARRSDTASTGTA